MTKVRIIPEVNLKLTVDIRLEVILELFSFFEIWL